MGIKCHEFVCWDSFLQQLHPTPPTMFKFSILAGLALALGAVSAAKNDSAAKNETMGIAADQFNLSFYPHWNLGGEGYFCRTVEFEQCYTFRDEIIASGLSSVTFDNYSIWVKRFTLTVYSGANCNVAYDRWSFTQTYTDPDQVMGSFRTLNDNVRSFKVANFLTRTQSGTITSPPEHTVMSSCAPFGGWP
ncbi:hypothetical protein BGZ72_005953 [Mortierella alpina]|nr:hypothetical protein BGZ72_005953 [Mortierella alpina]